ncbi:hypothetical protein [Kribbella sp. CA-293567]|uniref:hypothetical protein n=1 Tax=Kribbella sp. CA-293567 TaxID=3002436 RepID=UPI0022DE6728|nr:hypothetical protein [Kribbella sp. CA-293567]WBQ07307.1 hypothetical protein OX958_10985 [Kribbella sp. CA-293567]
MLWPALQALSTGELSEDQVSWLRETFGLTEGPRTEPPGAADSLAHRRLTDPDGVELVLDLACMNGEAWLFTLFQTTGDRPSASFVETQRAAFRAAIDHLGLRLVEIEPPATADEVLVVPEDPATAAATALDLDWDLPAELDGVWRYLQVRPDAPREVRAVKLRALMDTMVWKEAPAQLRREAQEFLDGH